MRRGLEAAAAALYHAGWEARRRIYARGWARPHRVAARVVSVGNLTVGGAGKTTLAIHLGRAALQRGLDPALVCRRYRPGPEGEGDEERLLGRALGAGRVFAGRSKRALAAAAAAAGHRWILVDDGFSHWPLARDLDLVLLEHGDPFGGGRLLPAGRLREPLRALQRAHVLILTRVPLKADLAASLAAIARMAPGARLAAARHRPAGVRSLAGEERAAGGAAHVVTATGNPQAVAASAAEAGFAPVTLAAYRDHHWFTEREVAEEMRRAQIVGARVLLTAKDAVRWPAAPHPGGKAPHSGEALVLETEWEWLAGGDEVERLVFAEGNEA